MSLPTSQRIEDAGATFNKFGQAGKRVDGDTPSKADRLTRQTLDLIRRAETGDVRADGYPTNTAGGGRSSNDPANLNSVESAAEQNQFGDTDRDRVLDVAQLASSHAVEAAYHLKAWENALELASSYLTPERGPGQEQAECKQIHCHDNSAPGRKGNCEACYRWLYDRNIGRQPGDEIAAVDKATIDKRVEERRTGKRKQRHENGPYADAAS